MATTSTVPDVRSAIESLYSVALGDSNVQVFLGRPQSNMVTSREVVVIGNVSYSSDIANIKAGRKQRDERYSIEMLFFVARPRGLASEGETRVWELFAPLENVLADDPTLGGVDGLGWAVLGAVEADTAIEDEGPVSWISANVNCVARLV